MKPLVIACMATVAMVVPVQGWTAGPATGTLTATATVASACTVSGLTLNFGGINPGTSMSVGDTISVSCQVGSSPTLWVSGGNLPYNNGAGLMKSGTNTIAYTLVHDSGSDPPVPDDSTEAASLTLDSRGHASYDVKAKIASGSTSQATPTGSYADVLTINVAY